LNAVSVNTISIPSEQSQVSSVTEATSMDTTIEQNLSLSPFEIRCNIQNEANYNERQIILNKGGRPRGTTAAARRINSMKKTKP
jgi:hypothetical protein